MPKFKKILRICNILLIRQAHSQAKLAHAFSCGKYMRCLLRKAARRHAMHVALHFASQNCGTSQRKAHSQAMPAYAFSCGKCNQKKKKTASLMGCSLFLPISLSFGSAADRNRTDTLLPERDFKSRASASSATAARGVKHLLK